MICAVIPRAAVATAISHAVNRICRHVSAMPILSSSSSTTYARQKMAGTNAQLLHRPAVSRSATSAYAI